MSICNTSGIEPYVPSTNMPWNIKRVKHLYRRAGFGANYATIQEALTKTPQEVVDALVDEALVKTPLEDPGWGYWDRDDLNENTEEGAVKFIGISFLFLKNAFYDNIRNDDLFGRMMMFWSNHFVTEADLIHSPSYLYQQYIMRQKYSLGNFKDFVHAVGIDPCMLMYLNGFENKAGIPNENYARELYELFTLGVDNGYTEMDIEETARALTGYNRRLSYWGDIVFNTATFDSEDKTIFGQTGNWGYDDVVNILFEQKADRIANYICTKFYKEFISSNIDETIVAQLAQTFVENNFEIAPVLRQLFKSEHFFNDDSIGVIIKSPMDLIIQYQKELDIIPPSDGTNDLNRRALLMGYYLDMDVLNPPNVAGWPGDEFWLNSVTIPERWLRMNHALIFRDDNVFANFAKALFPDDNTPVDIVAKGIFDFILTDELYFIDEYDEVINTFKDGVPASYFIDGTWDMNYEGLDKQVHNLLKYIIELPEFQLK